MAGAIGAGLPVQEATGSMIVDVGGGTTEVACISLGGIVASKALRLAGFDLDAAIIQHVRRDYAIAIGERTAEKVKIAIGSAVALPGMEDKYEVRGRELATGLPKTVVLTAGEVRQALEEPVSQIVQAVLDTLAAAPPELANDVLDKGIFLTGGSSMLRGLADRIAQEADVAVHAVDTPLECVALGAGRVIEEFDDLGPLFVESPRYL
jgi:rod shape-determining protein MreB